MTIQWWVLVGMIPPLTPNGRTNVYRWKWSGIRGLWWVGHQLVISKRHPWENEIGHHDATWDETGGKDKTKRDL